MASTSTMAPDARLERVQELVEALKSGNAAKIKEYAAIGCDWNQPITRGPGDVRWLPLHIAIGAFNADVVYLLLELGADPNRVHDVYLCPNLSPLDYARSFTRDVKEGYKAKKIVNILKKHLKTEKENLTSASKDLDRKIIKLSRSVSGAEDIKRKLDEIRLTRRNTAIKISTEKRALEKSKEEARLVFGQRREVEEQMKVIEQMEALLCGQIQAKEDQLEELKQKELFKLLPGQRREVEAQLEHIKEEMKVMLLRQMYPKMDELGLIKEKQATISRTRREKEFELWKLWHDNTVNKLISKQHKLRSKKSYMPERKLCYQRSMLRCLRKLRDGPVVKAIGCHLECVVCLTVPTSGNINACAVCGNILCAECAPKLDTCPMCRQDFRVRPYVRNMVAERIAHSLTI